MRANTLRREGYPPLVRGDKLSHRAKMEALRRFGARFKITAATIHTWYFYCRTKEGKSLSPHKNHPEKVEYRFA